MVVPIFMLPDDHDRRETEGQRSRQPYTSKIERRKMLQIVLKSNKMEIEETPTHFHIFIKKDDSNKKI
jgi:hypothetical protein